MGKVVNYKDSLEYKKISKYPFIKILFKDFYMLLDGVEANEYEIEGEIKSELCFIKEAKEHPDFHKDGWILFSGFDMIKSLTRSKIDEKDRVNLEDLQKIVDNHINDILLDFVINHSGMEIDDSFIYECFLTNKSQSELNGLVRELKEYNPYLYGDLTANKEEIFDSLLSSEFFPVAHSVSRISEKMKQIRTETTIYIPMDSLTREMFGENDQLIFDSLQKEVYGFKDNKEDVYFAMITEASLNEIMLQKFAKILSDRNKNVDVNVEFKNIVVGFVKPYENKLEKFGINVKKINLPIGKCEFVCKEDQNNALITVADIKYFEDKIYQNAKIEFKDSGRELNNDLKANNKKTLKI